MVRLGHTVAGTVASLARTDSRIWVVDGDLGDSYGVDSLAFGHLGKRFIQAGIAEQTMVGLAAGLAACGLRPWVFSFAAFLCCRAYDQIRISISQTELPVVLVGSHAGGCNGVNGKTHSAFNDLAIMSSLPNLNIWAPADPLDASFAAEQAMRSEVATYIRLPRDPQPQLPGKAGPARCFGSPGPVLMISTGLGTQWALDVRARLANLGIEIAVLHLARLQPLPEREIREALSPGARLIVIEDHYQCGGLADTLRRHFPTHELVSIAWPLGWSGASGEADVLRAACEIDSQSMFNRCVREFEEATSSVAALLS